MPGIASLQAQRYYAHPRNAFWPIVSDLCGFDVALPYEKRLQRAQEAGIALWDVLASCARPGSLDSAIEPDSIRTNDFGRFLAGHPSVMAIFCNGATAFRLFKQRVMPGVLGRHPDLSVQQLPSTSPAHASMKFAEKRAVWARGIQQWLR
jgi:hypoxanthine-DNA glycosylase